jgi:CheY-like chemotaxis protein
MLDTMQQTQKLDSLGVLAGGIAHDFNNLLSGIFGYIDLARMSRSLDQTASDYLESAMRVLTRAKSLTQQLLTFAKGGAPARKSGSLEKIVKECSLFALSGSSVTCRFTTEPDLFSCEFDENQICQVIDNIVLNGQQAMPMGGTIDVTLSNCHIEAGKHKILHEGEYIRITIKDSGIGIPKEIISRIFDPFFTTKEKGHGLGLATAYSIIRKHDGSIDVESETGKGSLFQIFLPASNKVSEDRGEDAGEYLRGSGKILLMDDEEFIRETVSAMLRTLGYEPICAKDGKETLALIAQSRETGENRLAAIILDLTIPGGIGGREVVTRIREKDKDIPVIVASGYSEDPVMAQPGNYGFSGSIAKPFTVKEISRLLKKLIKNEAQEQ